MKSIEGVIFDLDGTIANTLPLCIEAFRRSVEPLINRVVSEAEIIATFGPSEEGTIRALAPLHYDQGVAAYLSKYEQLHDLCPEPFVGITDLLVHLQEKGIRIALVTGKGKFSTAITLEKFRLTQFFEQIETGVPEGPHKPEGIEAVLNSWVGMDKEKVFYIGDAVSDITASRVAGIPVVAAAWAETAEPAHLLAMRPDQLFYTLPDFITWLKSRI